MARLVLIEGICGAGKSTLGGWVAEALRARGIPAVFYAEGAPDHPASLNGYGYVRTDDYAALLSRFPDATGVMRRCAVHGDGYMLLPFRDVPEIARCKALAAYLQARELCWADTPPAPYRQHCDARIRRWERFALEGAAQEGIFILEGVFFQHPIHDLMRLYRAGEADIGAFVRQVAEVVTPLCPLLLYLAPANVEAHQRWIAGVREKPHYAEAESIRRAQRRRRLEEALLDALPFPARIIAYDDPDWEDIRRRALDAIAVRGVC